MTASEVKTIFVAGATVLQGGAVAPRLLQDGWRGRGLTRDAESKRAWVLSALGAEVVQGGIGDADSLRPLFEGAYGVYSVQNPLIGGPEAEKTRLLTLTGPGGSGKTRLALKVARDLVEEFEDGVWLAYPRDFLGENAEAHASPTLLFVLRAPSCGRIGARGRSGDGFHAECRGRWLRWHIPPLRGPSSTADWALRSIAV